MCLDQGNNTVRPVRLKHAAPRSRVHLVLNLHLHSNFVLSRKGSDETVRMCRFNNSCAQKRLTLFILMDYPIHIDTILSMELSILYFKGLLVQFLK